MKLVKFALRFACLSAIDGRVVDDEQQIESSG